MAIIRLTDVVTVMKAKWTFGDSYFGYTEEFNDNHNTQYPSLLITPPNSVFPEVTLNNGWEEYSFEVYFSDLYGQTVQQNESIEQRWDNLQDLATEWLDRFLINYQEPNVLAMLNDESVEIERVKEVANDQLLQIRMLFTVRMFTKCFRPVSSYPSNINAANLLVWLRADSGLTFDIATKKVSLWADQSGNGNDIGQSTSGLQPLRYSYDGASDKSRIEFDGTNDYLSSGDEGADEIVNGTFDTTIPLGTAGSGWVSMDSLISGEPAAAYDSGGCKLTRVAGLCRLRARTVGGSNNILTSGSVYKLTYEVTGNNACTDFQIYHGGTSTAINETVGTHSTFFIEGASNQLFDFRNYANNSDITIDNVVVNEVPSGLSPITDESFGIFMVAKTTTDPTDDVRYFGYTDGDDDRIVLGSDGNKLQFKVVDDNDVSAEVFSIQDTTSYHISSARFDGRVGFGDVSLQYNNETEVTATIAGYVHASGWDDQVFTIGWVLEGATKNYLKGDIQEIIIYNGVVTNADRDKIKNYLNNKYNIY